MVDYLKKAGLITSVGVFFAAPALADSFGADATRQAAGLPSTVAGSTSVYALVGSIVAVALSLFGIIFFILILYAGFNWMVAQGNSEKIDKAKDTISGAAIGLIIVLAAYAITTFVFDALSNTTSTTTSDTSATGCCMLTNDNTKCLANTPQAMCNSSDSTWAAGSCPITCTN